jgi:hypothetical protein
LWFIILFNRYNEECVLLCPLNYFIKTGDVENICSLKQCMDRIPWANGSCSASEDESGEECYFSEMGDDSVGKCVLRNNCPNGYPGV